LILAAFMIRFLISNLFLIVVIGILLAAKRIFKKYLSGRMQYNLWFVLHGLLAAPFIPGKPFRSLSFFSLFRILKNTAASNTAALLQDSLPYIPSESADWMNDFTLSVTKNTPSAAGSILFGIWLIGIIAMLVSTVRAGRRFISLKSSALPLQNKAVRRLYADCLREMNITKAVPVYSTAFLKSPVITGLFRPRIYLPIRLLSDHNAAELRYILLHELQHYRHRDALGNLLMNIAGIFYWFNPVVRYALREMRGDREVACDTSVLEMLKEDDYENYGRTLIGFAEKMSLTSYPFAAGIGGSMKQMKKRILNIASYEKPSARKKIKGSAAFCLIAVLLLGFAPALSACAADEGRYVWNTSSENITYTDLSAYFEKYEGCFVLYDLENNSWNIYNSDRATLRTAPDSTYKIYDALFGLEAGVITPENSFLEWDRQIYPFPAWNADQDLPSAMRSSVNWYFQKIDGRLGEAAVTDYLHKIGYGNEKTGSDLASYWMESSLKISPVEQVRLLTGLYHNDFGFSSENIDAVKDSIRLSSSEAGTFYGKTGTGRIDGQDVNGWFIGYVEASGRTCFFAVNIAADADANGSSASEIARSVLSDMNIWNPQRRTNGL